MSIHRSARRVLPILCLLASCSDPSSGDGDRDGDGLSDADERAGWDISVDRVGLGSYLVEHVEGDPNSADGDGDGLTDAEEFQQTDPQRADTDGDGLDDGDEVRVYLSVATAVDSDGDSVSAGRSFTQLWDGNEINSWSTSPSLADTDGDNKTDFEEIIDLARNPVVAQLPAVKLDLVGPLDIRLDVTYSSGTTTSDSYGNAYAIETSNATTRSEGTVVASTQEQTLSVTVEVESGWPPSASASFTGSRTTGFSQEGSTSLEESASRSAQSEYQRAFETSLTSTEDVASGSLSIGLAVSNPSLIPYTLTNLAVTVYQWDESQTQYRTLATLTPASTSLTVAAMSSQSFPNQVTATGVNAALVREFLRAPSRLFFGISNFDMTNADGLNYAFLDVTTRARTGRVVIDYGDGTVEDYRVATNVRRNPNGTPAGVPLSTVFGPDYLDIDYATEAWAATGTPGTFANKVGVQVLTRVRAVSTTAQSDPELGFWAIYSNLSDLAGNFRDFGSTVLRQGESIYVAYLRDRDRDGVFDREEAVYGTSDTDADADGDGLDDYAEIRTGWTAGTGLVPATTAAGVGYPRLVRSDPTTTDADADGLTDDLERAAGTDPFRADTDGDQIDDGTDTAPLDGSNVGPIVSLTLTAGDPVVTLTGAIADVQDGVTSATVDWGDGTTTMLSSGFAALNLPHSYLSPGTHTIVVTATDGRGATSTQTFSATTTVLPGLLGEYRFDGGSLDSGPNGRHATLTNYNSTAPFVANRTGATFRALRFTADFSNNEYVYANVPNFGAIDINNFAVSFWYSGAGHFLSQQGAFAIVAVNDSTFELRFGPNDPSPTVITGAQLTSTWRHLVVSKSGTNVSLYVNGALYGTGTHATVATSGCTSLFFSGSVPSTGCASTQDFGTAGSSLDGAVQNTFVNNAVLDDVRIYSRPMSQSDATTLYLLP